MGIYYQMTDPFIWKIFFRILRRDTPMKIFYLFYLELKRKLFRIRHTAEFDLTENCNLKCIHCYHFKKAPIAGFKEESLDAWKERMLDLFKKGIRNVLLAGGEPALRMDVLMLANEIFPTVYVITNGLIKIPENFRHTIFLSIDGMEKTNDRIRGEGTFSKIIANYRNDRRVIINMTLMKENYKELENVVKLSIANGFIGVVCNIYTHYNFDIADDKLIADPQERSEIIREMKRVKKLYPANLLFSPSMIKWYEFPDHRKSCYWRENTLHFDASFTPRRCFGEADCSDCGCFAGAISCLAAKPFEQASYSLLLRFRKFILLLRSFLHGGKSRR